MKIDSTISENEILNYLRLIYTKVITRKIHTEFVMTVETVLIPQTERGGKLFLFSQVFNAFGRYPFVDSIPTFMSSSIIKMMVSCHHLRVETGRWKKTPREERKCCVCGTLEDELHAIYECPKYQDARQNVLGEKWTRLDNYTFYCNLYEALRNGSEELPRIARFFP